MIRHKRGEEILLHNVKRDKNLVVGLLTNHVPSPILQEKKTTRVYCPTRALFYHLKLQKKKKKISLFRIQISEARHPPEGLTVSMTSEKPENHENVVDEYTRKEERTILDKYRRSHLHSPAKQIECPLSCLFNVLLFFNATTLTSYNMT